MTEDENALAGRLIERLLVDPVFRAEFRRDPAGACVAAGLPGLAGELGGGGGMETLELRESRSSLAGVVMAAAVEGLSVAEAQAFVEHGVKGLHGVRVPGRLGHGVRVPSEVQKVRGLEHRAVGRVHRLEHEVKGGGSAAQGLGRRGRRRVRRLPRRVGRVRRRVRRPLSRRVRTRQVARRLRRRPQVARRPRLAARRLRRPPPRAPPRRVAPAAAGPGGVGVVAAVAGCAKPRCGCRWMPATSWGRGRWCGCGCRGPGGAVVGGGAGPQGLSGLLEAPGLQASPQVRAFLASGGVDPRVVSVLDTVLAHHSVGVADVVSTSSPVHVQAIDIVSVDGQPVGPENFAARDLVTEIAAMDSGVRPDEIGTPWPIQSPGFFSDQTSQGSLHLAFEMPGANSARPPRAWSPVLRLRGRSRVLRLRGRSPAQRSRVRLRPSSIRAWRPRPARPPPTSSHRPRPPALRPPASRPPPPRAAVPPQAPRSTQPPPDPAHPPVTRTSRRPPRTPRSRRPIRSWASPTSTAARAPGGL